MNYDYSARTHVGRQRERNEDSLVAQVVNGRFIGVVADGMGGHQAGETASRLAVDAIKGITADLSEAEGVSEVLLSAVRSANERIHKAGAYDEQLTGMGTTFTGAVVEPGRAWLAHVGDSRAYLLRDGQIAQLTADDSLVEELVRRGHLSEEEAQGHPQRNLLLRALGVTGTVEVGVQEEILQAGDVLLLCSDGLTNMVSDREIADIVHAAGTLEEAAEKLITAANERGGYDNITVVLVRCPEGEAGEQGSKGAGEQGRMVNGEWLMANGQPSAISHQPSTRGRLTDSSLIPHPSSLARRKTWRPLLKVLAGVGLVAALLWGGWRLGQAYLARQYFLSAANGQVVLYQGLPRQLMGRPLYHPYQLMKEPVGRVMERYRESLQRGIVVASPEEATKRLQEILEPHAENGTASGSL